MNDLPVFDDRYKKTKIRMYGDKVYTNFRALNVPEYCVECKSFTIISIDYLLVYESKYHVEVYLYKCAYETINTEILDNLDDNLFEADEN